ncbi:hypothetical protein HS1genome_1692 [Sulfodiicoccus acidiphilus]|uniref:ATPase domain-containing protein n=1 Tax=Sulfodiicoccus acidiphilus TaxID=1670455 RepID=A0A348B551_9CREN|nr:hypothetical protein HS1genome_1692 [Sulfodiicoccus acidiphilus]GGT89250.1 hypothetical protein GCM10007116_03870 [Sulfodiicoccus acidiphilus]
MLFDPRPETSRKDLYDREGELRSLIEGVRFPLTVVSGLRRTGKFSLIRVAMGEDVGNLWMYLDMRKFEDSTFISYRDFLWTLEGEINDAIRNFPRLLESPEKIRGLSISGLSVSLAWGGELRFANLLDALQEYGEEHSRDVIVVFDEAQELIKSRGLDLLPQIPYVYDNLRRIRFVVGDRKLGCSSGS